MKHITLIRHAETDANAAGIWQGHGDAGLSGAGRAQAAALGERISGWHLDRVVASDLERALATAEVVGLEPIPDAAWREMNIGEWEGLTRDEVFDRFADDMRKLRSGSDVAMGGGERWSEFASRVRTAFDRLVAEMADGERALVVTHGGVIHAAVASVLGIDRGLRPWPLQRVRNTAMTSITVSGEWMEVAVYNDASHLDLEASEDLTEEDLTEVALIRHAESEANVRGEWHGSSDGPLSERGFAQAADLAAHLPPVAALYASPSERARVTAAALSSAHGLDIVVDDGLAEMHVGAWEGRTTDEIRREYPEEWAAVFDRGEDLARGGSGETFRSATDRARRAIHGIVDRHPGQRVAVVTHGVLMRVIVADVLGVPWPRSRRVGLPMNTGRSRIGYGSDGPVLVEHNV